MRMNLKKMDRKTMSLIFSGLACIGVGATGVLSAMRAPRYKEILVECDGSKPKAVTRTFWPAFAAGAATVVSIALAEKINLTEIASITGVCTYLVHQRDRIFKSIRNRGGDELFNKVLKAAPKDTEKEGQIVYLCQSGPSIEETGRGDLLCLESYTGRLFRSSEADVLRAIDRMNQHMAECDCVCMNTFYGYLGILQTRFGDENGWPGDEGYADYKVFDYVYFNTGQYPTYPTDPFIGLPLEKTTVKTYNAEPMLVIDILEPPMYGWKEM